MIGDREQMRAVRRVSSPYNVNGVALACLPEALADQEYIQNYVNEVLHARRTRLESALRIARTSLLAEPGKFRARRVG